MNPLTNNLNGLIYKVFLSTFVFMLAIVFSGCSGNYGRLDLSLEVEKTFENAEVLSDHKYYYSGGETRPRAILAIHNSYKLRTSRWKEVDLKSEELKKWILQMRDFLVGYSFRTYGSRVLDPEGNQVGMWYSAWNRTPVKMLGGNEVAVYAPMVGAAEISHGYLESGWRSK